MKEIFKFSPKHKTNLAKKYFTIDSKEKDHKQVLFKVKYEFHVNFLNLTPKYILGSLIISSQIYILACFSFLL